MEPLEAVGIFHTRAEAERARRWLEDEGLVAQLIDIREESTAISARVIDAAVNPPVVGVRLEVARKISFAHALSSPVKPIMTTTCRRRESPLVRSAFPKSLKMRINPIRSKTRSPDVLAWRRFLD
jgi:hypothetical protein